MAVASPIQRSRRRDRGRRSASHYAGGPLPDESDLGASLGWRVTLARFGLNYEPETGTKVPI